MTPVIPEVEKDERRNRALLKAMGLDKVPEEQREITLAIAKRYDLDPMLRHILLVDGRPYITRDGLLHIAHRSGVFDGMEVSDPSIVDIGPGKFWSARCSVYRKDMGRPFTYAGRYPTQGGNQKFAPEMATKVAEVMALRRAFDVSAPVMEERWDLDTPAPETEPAKSLDERIAERAERVAPVDTRPVHAALDKLAQHPEPPAEETIDGAATEVVQCDSVESQLGEPVRCRKAAGHTKAHTSGDRSW